MKEIYKDNSQPAAIRAQDLLEKMTVKEKVGQLNQRLYGFRAYECVRDTFEVTEYFKQEVDRWGGLGILYGLYRADPWSEKHYDNGICGDKAITVYNALQKYVLDHSRFEIPMLLSTECPHGHQALNGYLLPVNLAMGAAFHPELVQKAYEICGSQMKEIGVDLALISMLDVLRDPRWGRSEECFGEDPLLASKMTEAVVKGVQSKGVSVVAKHFAAQGETTGGINASAARIGVRELREIHLPPATAAVKAGVHGIMAAYNDIDGIPCHGNAGLLKKILREEMGFDGIVMADGTAVDRLNILTGDCAKSGALALKSGVDVSLWDEGFTQLETALTKGYISEKSLDEAVYRVLKLKFDRGLFEHPFLPEKKRIYDFSNHTEHLQLARESIVLLKNRGKLLPLSLKQPKKILVTGPNAFDIYSQLGDYTPPLKDGEGVTIAHGIEKLIQSGKKADITLTLLKGCEFDRENEGLLKVAVTAAKNCDVIILVLGGSSGRFDKAAFDNNGAVLSKGDCSMDCGEGVDLSDLRLPKAQRKLAESMFTCGKKVITFVIAGRPYDISKIAKQTDGLFYMFYPGPKGGIAAAELLFGREEPSGRLPVSLPRSTGQIPAAYNYRISYEAMHYSDEKDGALFSFGAGLGYKSPVYDRFTINKETLCIEFFMTNTTKDPLYGVPMVFIRRLKGSIVPRNMELAAFKKVKLDPKQSRRIEILLNQELTEAEEILVMVKDGGTLLWEEAIIWTEKSKGD